VTLGVLMSRLLIAILMPLLLAPRVSVAQAPDSLVKEQRIRVVTRCKVVPGLAPDCPDSASRWTYIGQLEGLDQDSLRVRSQSKNAERVIPTASIVRLEVADGTKGHFWTGAGIGLLGGALIGAVIGSTTGFCTGECTDAAAQEGAIAAGAVLGASAGFLVGGVIGSQIRTERWRLISIDDHLIGVVPRFDAPGFAVDVRF
jgi:hypothetical protein